MDYNNIYFIGIGGIGMSAIARYFKFKGLEVAGYDKTPSEITEALCNEGIPVHYDDRPEMIPADTGDTLVVYTPAIPESLKELQYAREHGYRILKRSQILGEITRGQKCLAVAGTHGKTTTSTLVAHILTSSGNACSAFLGGISKNYGTNMLMSRSDTVVVEADEFDRSFHQLHPDISVITAMDADHLDIYGDLEHVQESFRIYASQVKDFLIIKKGLPIADNVTDAKIYTYHLSDAEADFHATNMSIDRFGHYTFDLVSPFGTIRGIRVGTLGWVNVENSIAAAAECLCFGVDADGIKEAIGTFSGAKRRLDEHINRPGLTYIDDYAHHPEELGAAISSIREMFPQRHITAVFQPHLYTRTRDFADDFARVLSNVDRLILLDIYPAREEPIPGVNSGIILDAANTPEKMLVSKDGLLDFLKSINLDVLVTFGAGNIDRLVEPINEMLKA